MLGLDEGAPVAVLAGRYRLGAALGRGGMSTVYRGWDQKLERNVAVKIFASDDPIAADRERRLREARVLAAARHPHLVALFDAEWPVHPDVQRQAFLVMELVEGESLHRRIDRDGPDPDLAMRVCAQLGAALEYLHARGIVHRDVKPANILIEDADGSVKLVDFGIAWLSGSERITTTGIVLGTAAYLSPEQVSGDEAGAASDIYSLGLVVLECLTGRREYPGSPAEAGVARLVRAPLIPPGLSEGWRSLLGGMTQRDPAARPSASQLVRAVGSLLEQADLPTIGHEAPAVSGAASTEPLGATATTEPLLAAAPPEPQEVAVPSEPNGVAPTEPIGAPAAVGTGPMEAAAASGTPAPATRRSRWKRFTVALAALLVAAGMTGGTLAWTSLSGPHPPRRTPTPTVVVTVTPAPPPVEAPAPANPGGDQRGGGDGGRNGGGSGNGNGNSGGNGNGNGNPGNSGNHGNSGH